MYYKGAYPFQPLMDFSDDSLHQDVLIFKRRLDTPFILEYEMDDFIWYDYVGTFHLIGINWFDMFT